MRSTSGAAEPRSPSRRAPRGRPTARPRSRWEVPDLRRELDELRSRGVTIEDYDLPDLKTVDGIADVGFAWMAWIIDPGKNALAILELKS